MIKKVVFYIYVAAFALLITAIIVSHIYESITERSCWEQCEGSDSFCYTECLGL